MHSSSDFMQAAEPHSILLAISKTWPCFQMYPHPSTYRDTCVIPFCSWSFGEKSMDGESRASRHRLLRKSSRFDIRIIYRIFPGKPASLIQKWSDHITSFHMNLSNREVATVSHESYPVVTSHWYPNWHVGRWLSGRGGFVQVTCATFSFP